MGRRYILVFAFCVAALVRAAAADSFTGADWAVRFNRPDQTTTTTSVWPDEYVIRDAFLARIDALASNDWGCLATYTFSGNSAAAGAAGPILLAMSNALARGAKVAFVADNGVNIASNYWPGISLTGLATRTGNKLELSRAPVDWGIMHDKVGVFWYRAATQAWVLSGSWNFTGGASSYQWNVLAEIQNRELAAAYSNEMREMLSGRFHANTNKSHAHDGARFRLADTWTNGWVRFAPYPDKTYGGSNALTDVVAAIDAATNEIVFALNKLTRPDVANALIRACDRGVRVHGAFTRSDLVATNPLSSYPIYAMLQEPANYATANRVFLYDAYASAKRLAYDSGEADLVHAKYMAIDPRGSAPLAIHGSANWTEAALVDDRSNDENVLFLPHAGLAQALVAQFNAMTDGTVPWFRLESGGEAATGRFVYWLPYTNRYEVLFTANLLEPAAWTNLLQGLPPGRGTNAVTTTNRAERGFFRLRQIP
jgi:phosphatidylserine/phosphatidylglycerophosphate/cardiolipin synthase-like enzyme